MMCFGERNKMNAFLLHISHAISCCNVKVTDLYIGWSKEMMNTTTELLTYCTVKCIFELSCVMLKWLKDKPSVSYILCIIFFIFKFSFSLFLQNAKSKIHYKRNNKVFCTTENIFKADSFILDQVFPSEFDSWQHFFWRLDPLVETVTVHFMGL